MGYFGGKQRGGVYHKIIAAMPRHEVYIEAFAGAGAVFRHKPRAPLSYLIDLDRHAPALRLATKRPGKAGRPIVYTICADAIAALDEFDYERSRRPLVYADPPYLHSERGTKRYRFDMTDSDHRKLAKVLRRIPANVILSGYPSALYDRLYRGWRTIEFQTMTLGGVRTEKLWFNFDPGEPFWASFTGKDFTDRQRIKRKATSWATKYAGLPKGERLAIMQALNAVDCSSKDVSDCGRRRGVTRRSP